MDNSISNSIMPQFRMTYQDLPASDKARVEQSATQNPMPFKATQPTMPTRPAPKAPSSSASSIKTDDNMKETPVRNDDVKASLANRLGAKLLVAGASSLNFLQKVVNAIVSAAKAVVVKVGAGAKAAKTYVTGLSIFNKPVVLDEKAKDASETSSTSDSDDTK